MSQHHSKNTQFKTARSQEYLQPSITHVSFKVVKDVSRLLQVVVPIKDRPIVCQDMPTLLHDIAWDRIKALRGIFLVNALNTLFTKTVMAVSLGISRPGLKVCRSQGANQEKEKK